MNVETLIQRARDEIANAKPVTKSILLGGELVGVRLQPISGSEWRDLTARHLPREGSFFDQNLGFNIDATVRDYPKVSVVTGDGDVDSLYRDGEGGVPRYIWPDVAAALDAPALEILAQALWEIHQFDPAKRMVEAGKALRGGRQKKRSLPANSA